MISTNKNDYLINMNQTKPYKSSTKYREWDFGEISLLTLVIFGAITNSLTVLVMTRKRMRNSNASLYITFMAICDFLVLLFKFLANMIKLYRISIYNFCIIIQVVPQAASFISVWLIMATSAERTAAVLVPLKVIHLFSRKRSKIIIYVIILTFVLISSSVSFCIEYSTTQPYYCRIKGNINGTCFKYYTFIFPWFRSALGSWIPSIFGLIFSLIMIRALSKASLVRKNITNQILVKFKPKSSSRVSRSNESGRSIKLEEFKILLMKGRKNSFSSIYTAENSRERSLSERSSSWRALSSVYSQQTRERQITIMLLTISISFIVLTFPYSIFELFRKLGFKPNFLRNRLLLRFVMLLIDLNHSTNFVLFCLTARRFRNELRYIFREIQMKISKK